MSPVSAATAPWEALDRFFINGEWIKASSRDEFEVVNPANEEVFFRVAEAKPEDLSRAIGAARNAFDYGPWPRLTHAERAEFLRLIAAGLDARSFDLSHLWSGQVGILHALSSRAGGLYGSTFRYYADLAGEFPFIEEQQPFALTPEQAGGQTGILIREPVGVVGAIIPWNGPMALIAQKVAPALLAGCTVVVKVSPEAPGEGYVLAEIAEQVGLPAGVINVVTTDREVSELLVRDPRVDKITFTGSTAAGRRIASLCGERIARVTLELGGKSAAVVLDDYDIAAAAATLAGYICVASGQVCNSLTRVVIGRDRHDEMLEALAAILSKMRAGDPFDPTSNLGPLAMRRQRDRVEGYIAEGVAEGAQLAAGGGRPADLAKGFYIEPTLFGGVDNASTIAQEEIFGPVLCVIPADDERQAMAIANDTIYGLNASVFTNDADRALGVARQLRSGTVGHNAVRGDLGIAFGGFKQSGIGREGGKEGLLPFLELKTVVLESRPSAVS